MDEKEKIPEPIKQITLRVPQSVHEQLKAAAKRKGISVNEEIIFRIQPISLYQDEDSHVPSNTCEG